MYLQAYQHVFTSRVKNSVDPDQLASEKPADLNLHCFKHDISRFNMVRKDKHNRDTMYFYE